MKSFRLIVSFRSFGVRSSSTDGDNRSAFPPRLSSAKSGSLTPATMPLEIGRASSSEILTFAHLLQSEHTVVMFDLKRSASPIALHARPGIPGPLLLKLAHAVKLESIELQTIILSISIAMFESRSTASVARSLGVSTRTVQHRLAMKGVCHAKRFAGTLTGLSVNYFVRD